MLTCDRASYRRVVAASRGPPRDELQQRFDRIAERLHDLGADHEADAGPTPHGR